MTANATPGDIFAALYAAHLIGDYWCQTGAQARDKGLPGPRGRIACGKHAASVTACKVLALMALHVSGRHVGPARAVLALTADAASHYLADRRNTGIPSGLPRLAFLAGQREFWELGDGGCLGTGGHAMDQAFHIACLWLTALIAGRTE